MTQDLLRESFELLAQARRKMISAIENEVKEKDCIEYVFPTSHEPLFIKFNEDKRLVLLDDCDNELDDIEELNAVELQDICLQISH